MNPAEKAGFFFCLYTQQERCLTQIDNIAIFTAMGVRN